MTFRGEVQNRIKLMAREHCRHLAGIAKFRLLERVAIELTNEKLAA